MKVLGIETSCDETAASVCESGSTPLSVTLRSNIVHSQIALHAEYGGVVPNLAKREHEQLLVPTILAALKEASLSPVDSLPPNIDEVAPFFERNQTLLQSFRQHAAVLTKPDIDLIAVTNGPGLEPALWVGVSAARALSLLWDVPLIGVDHMEGHIAANLIEQDNHPTLTEADFPLLALTISGGHTQLVLMRAPLTYELLGETMDDAAGEAFDKAARLLGLPYPGGPAIAKLAAEGEADAFPLPRPMRTSGDYNFSFSGLKTAVRYLTEELGEAETQRRKADIAASFQQAVIDTVVEKTVRAANEHGARTVVLAGGVAANTELRRQLGDAIAADTQAAYHVPPIELATDNAAMIAASGLLRAVAKEEFSDARTIGVDSNKQIGATS